MWDFVLISNFHLSNNPWCQVGIQHVMASFLPGHYFPQGRHHVLYQVDSSKQNVFSLFGVFLLFQWFCSQAADGDGNRARCGFTITVKPQPAFNPLQVSVGCFTLTVCTNLQSVTRECLLIFWTVVTLTTSPSSSATKFSESAASLSTSSTSQADLAALTRQVFKIMLFCLHKRSWTQDHRDLFCQPVCFVVTRDFDRKIIEIFLPAGRTRCSSFPLPDSLLRRRHRFPSIAKRSTTILIRYCSISVALHKCKHYNDTQELPWSHISSHHRSCHHLHFSCHL